MGAACLHNIYGNGDFGDGRAHAATPRRRRMVREAVGAEVEGCINRFRALRLTERSVLDVRKRLDEFDARDRHLIVIELADFLEKYADHGVLYYGDHRWVTGFVDSYGKVLIEIAERLGHPQLGAALHQAFAATALESVPQALWSADNRKYMELTVPCSCRLRLTVAARHKLSAMARLLQEMLNSRLRTRHAKI